MAIELKEWNILEQLKTEEDIALYLTACFEDADGDTEFIIHALQDAVKARSLIAKQTENSELTPVGIFDLIKELGLKIQVSPTERNEVL
jgi:DNA-binding phage protein